MMERCLTKEEFIQLCREPKRESDEQEIQFYDISKERRVEETGFISDGRPVYFAMLIESCGRYHLWTVYSERVREKIRMYQLAKNRVTAWAKKYQSVYSTMERDYPECRRWVEKMGFKFVSEDTENIILRLEA